MFDRKMWLEWMDTKMKTDVSQKEARSSYSFTNRQSLSNAINEVMNRKPMQVDEFKQQVQLDENMSVAAAPSVSGKETPKRGGPPSQMGFKSPGERGTYRTRNADRQQRIANSLSNIGSVRGFKQQDEPSTKYPYYRSAPPAGTPGGPMGPPEPENSPSYIPQPGVVDTGDPGISTQPGGVFQPPKGCSNPPCPDDPDPIWPFLPKPKVEPPLKEPRLDPRYWTPDGRFKLV